MEDAHIIEEHYENYSRTVFGFWAYLMTDCILFGTLFATYAVLHGGTFGGPTSRDLFSLPFALTETLILLVSSFTCGIAILAAYKKQKMALLFWLMITFILGVSFLTLELREFTHLVRAGHSWQASAFLSAFFTLVGTHGVHITFGLIWMVFLMIQTGIRGFPLVSLKRLACLSMFWHFLDIVWIFIFTIVYLMGAI